MDSFQIFGLQMTLSLIVFSLLGKWYLAPKLATWDLYNALIVLIFPQALRHLGLTVLATAAVDPNFPKEWSVPAAVGDMIAEILALVCLIALHARSPIAIALVWIFNIEGFLDFLFVIGQGMRLEITRFQFNGFWYVPTFWVPVLIVSHVLIFNLLLKRRSK
jgi:hypothetical protein